MVSSIMWEALKREVSLGEGWLYSDVLYKFDLILLQAIFFFYCNISEHHSRNRWLLAVGEAKLPT